MKKNDHDKWGPQDELGRLIRKVPYAEPSPDLEVRIMARLKTQPPGVAQRIVQWFKEPMTLRVSPALAVLVMVFCILSGGYLTYHYHGGRSYEEAGTSQAGIPVVLYYKGKDARSVAVIGSFNNWNPKGYELEWKGDLGRWALKLHLQPGKHDYVFLINGEKVYPDPDADMIQEDDFGNRNSVLFIKGQNGIQI